MDLTIRVATFVPPLPVPEPTTPDVPNQILYLATGYPDGSNREVKVEGLTQAEVLTIGTGGSIRLTTRDVK